MPVGRLATEDVSTAEKNTSIKELAQQMDEAGVGDVVIVEDGKPVGLVTDRKIALAVGQQDDLDSVTAEDLMTGDLVTIDQGEEGFQAAKTMGENRIRRVPVVDDDGQLAGIVTLDDVVATVGEELEEISDVIEAQSPDYSPD